MSGRLRTSPRLRGPVRRCGLALAALLLALVPAAAQTGGPGGFGSHPIPGLSLEAPSALTVAPGASAKLSVHVTFVSDRGTHVMFSAAAFPAGAGPTVNRTGTRTGDRTGPRPNGTRGPGGFGGGPGRGFGDRNVTFTLDVDEVDLLPPADGGVVNVTVTVAPGTPLGRLQGAFIASERPATPPANGTAGGRNFGGNRTVALFTLDVSSPSHGSPTPLAVPLAALAIAAWAVRRRA